MATGSPASQSNDSRARNLIVLISGSGTNFQTLIDACGSVPLETANIAHVISNKKDAYGLAGAQDASIPTTYHSLIAGGYKAKYPERAREEYNVDLANLIIRHGSKPDLQ